MNRLALVRPLSLCLAGLFILGQLTASLSLNAQDGAILEFTGSTMGTRFMVKVYEPPEFEDDIRFEVDAQLRSINDLMSTYLESSELSRFNRNKSTEWFEVSSETATVVAFAQSVSQRTEGAFDVTVGPLVNAWSFGPDPRTQTIPDAETLKRLRDQFGYEKLSVRADPPALRKSIPQLQVDLSAIAKGYAVDKLVELLNEAGAPNVFVEIGGEIRTSGSKSGQWWKVGIQVPDAVSDAVLIAHSMSTGAGDDESMATSGDYRNFFEVDGVRYSHTIDPRSARPIEHALASVSVVMESCMAADAWATALNVLGPDRGLEAAEQEGISALLIRRQQDSFAITGSGSLAQYATTTESPLAEDSVAHGGVAHGDSEKASDAGQSVAVMVLTACAFGLILSAMAIGVMFGRRTISGSCGGLANSRNDDGSVSCSLCSNPSDACKELRERMEQGSQTEEEPVHGA